MKHLLKKIDTHLAPLWAISPCALDITVFIARLHMANIFWKSGYLKLKSILNGNFDDVVLAFTDFHPIPGVSPTIAAAAGTAGELILPVMLAFGLFGRVGAAGLLIMSAVIQFLVPAEYDIAHPQHYFWMIILAVPLFYGMGKISLDYWIAKWVRG